jgi:hypothetical protein
MKKVLSLAMALGFAATAALALQEPPVNPDPQPVSQQQPVGTTYVGTITVFDSGARSLSIRDADGKVTTYYWTETVKVPAELKVGDPVTIVATDQNGRLTASSIVITTKTTTQKKTKY